MLSGLNLKLRMNEIIYNFLALIEFKQYFLKKTRQGEMCHSKHTVYQISSDKTQASWRSRHSKSEQTHIRHTYEAKASLLLTTSGPSEVVKLPCG